jgi:hypothetical protein
MQRKLDQQARSESWTRYAKRRSEAGGDKSPSRARAGSRNGRYVVGAALILAVLVAPFAIAQPGPLGGSAAKGKKKSVRLKCKSGSACLKVNGKGKAFGFKGKGPAGIITVRDSEQPPFATNAKGKVANLNADRLDDNKANEFMANKVRIERSTSGPIDGNPISRNVSRQVANCRSSEKVIAGGASWVKPGNPPHDPTVVRGAEIPTSRPSLAGADIGPPDAASGWEVIGVNNSADTLHLQSYAMCVSRSP